MDSYMFSTEVEFKVVDYQQVNYALRAPETSSFRSMLCYARDLRCDDELTAAEQEELREQKIEEPIGKMITLNEIIEIKVGGKVREVKECKLEEDQIEAILQNFVQ